MVIHDVKNDRGQNGKFQASIVQLLHNFWQILGKFWACLENGLKWSKKVKNGQNGQTGQKWSKCQIYKVQYRSLQMSSSIRL